MSEENKTNDTEELASSDLLCQKIPTMTASEIAEFKKMAKKCMMQDPHYKDVITSWVHPDGRILVENIQLNPE